MTPEIEQQLVSVIRSLHYGAREVLVEHDTVEAAQELHKLAQVAGVRVEIQPAIGGLAVIRI
jgi:phosphomevalonate kinase